MQTRDYLSRPTGFRGFPSRFQAEVMFTIRTRSLNDEKVVAELRELTAFFTSNINIEKARVAAENKLIRDKKEKKLAALHAKYPVTHWFIRKSDEEDDDGAKKTAHWNERRKQYFVHSEERWIPQAHNSYFRFWKIAKRRPRKGAANA